MGKLEYLIAVAADVAARNTRFSEHSSLRSKALFACYGKAGHRRIICCGRAEISEFSSVSAPSSKISSDRLPGGRKARILKRGPDRILEPPHKRLKSDRVHAER